MEKSKDNFIKDKGRFKFLRSFSFILFIFIFSFLIFSTKASANTYYVSTTGLDSYSGTLAQPFKTITKGLTVAAAGDTVLVKAGTYPEYVRFFNSGTVGNPITLKNYGTDVVNIDAENTRVYSLYLGSVSNIVIDGINVKNATHYNIFTTGVTNLIIKNFTASLPLNSTATNENMILEGAAPVWDDNITIENFTMTGGRVGIMVNRQIRNVNIISGEISNSSESGMNIGVDGLVNPTASDLLISPHNIIVNGVYSHNNGISGIGTRICMDITIRNSHLSYNGGTGIQIEADTVGSLLENNLSEYNSRNGTLYNYETGIWVFNSQNSIVRRNTLRGNQTGLRISKVDNFQAYNNIIIDNNYKSIQTQNTSGVDFSESTGTFYNNVLSGNAASDSKLGSLYVYPISIPDGDTIPSNITIKNNIIMNDGSSKDMDFDQSGASVVVSDNNLVYNANRTVNIQKGDTNYSWSSYKSATGQDSHSINANPIFVSITDFNLQSSSPAINAGVNVGLTTDYLGNPIIGLPDIGAYESNYSTSKTYYVATTGSDTNAGTSTLPFKTIQKAANVVNPGDTVIVKDGTYTGPIGQYTTIVTLNRGGTAGNYVTFKSENKYGAILNGQNYGTAYGFNIRSSYIKIDGFEMTRLSDDGVVSSNSAANSYTGVIIKNNKIHDIGHVCLDSDSGINGLYIGSGANDYTIDSNLIYDIGRLAEGENGCHYVINPEPYKWHDHGIYAGSYDSDINNLNVINNVFYGIEHGWPIHYYREGGTVNYYNNNSNIRNNTIYGSNPWAQGRMIFYYTNGANIENNIISESGTCGVVARTGATINARNNLVSPGRTFKCTGVGIYSVDVNNIIADPLLTNTASYNFILQQGSPAINAGIASSRTIDILGNPIIGLPDIGAYESNYIVAPTTYTISYTPGTGGTISGTLSQTINSGSNGTSVTAVPSTGYSFSSWSDGITTASRTETNVTSNKSVTANFTINTYGITASSGSNGTVTPSGVTTKNYGTSQIYTITPSLNYHIVNVLIDGSSVGTVGTYTFSNITTTHTISATFAVNVVAPTTYTISYTPGTGGTISGTLSQTINSGSNGTSVTAVPSTGYSFSSWSDGITTASRTETNVTANKTITATFTIIPTSGGGGGGGGGYTPPVVNTPVVITIPSVTTTLPITNLDQGCALGNIFSITTGKLCPKTNTPSINTLKLTKTLRYGSRLNDRNEVKILQQILITKGYLTGTADGIFGRVTLASVKAFQTANGLKSDGVVGAGTREVLNR